MQTYFHVSLKENSDSILKNGLIPKIGKLSEKLELMPAVFLFKDELCMEEALTNWMYDELEENYGEDVEIICFEISLPNNFLIYDSIASYEKISYEKIDSKYISIIEI